MQNDREYEGDDVVLNETFEPEMIEDEFIPEMIEDDFIPEIVEDDFIPEILEDEVIEPSIVDTSFLDDLDLSDVAIDFSYNDLELLDSSFIPEQIDLSVDRNKEELILKLKELGYESVDELDVEVLYELDKRLEHINDTKVVALDIKSYCDVIQDLFIKLTQSKATYNKESSYDFSPLLKALTDTKIENELALQTFAVASSLIDREGSNISPKMIMEELLRVLSENDKKLLELQGQDLYNTLQLAIPTIITSTYNESMVRYANENYRKSISKYLLDKELDVLQKLVKFDGNNISIISQVFRESSDKFYYICSKCKEKHYIDVPIMTIVTFPTERDNINKFVPNVLSCSCGNDSILPIIDYENIRKSSPVTKDKVIKEFAENSSNFCKGASFARVSVDILQAQEFIDYMLVNYYAEEQVGSLSEVKTEEETLILNDKLFMEAVKRFYNKLEGCTSISSNRRLTYKEVAYYFASSLSKDYNTLKNQAIFSLLFSFEENPILSLYLNNEISIQYRNYLLLINDSNYNPKLIPEETMAELLFLCNTLTGTNYSDIYSEKDRITVMETLANSIPRIESFINNFDTNRETIINKLSEYSDVLAYTKIMNISFYKLKDFHCYVSDKETFELLDIVSDRMIINNYSGEFFNNWIKLQIMNKNTTKTNILKSTKSEEIKSSLLKAVDKLFKKYSTAIDGYELETIFDMCFKMTASHLEIVSDLFENYKDFNYYKFCKIALDIDSTTNLLMGKNYQNDFIIFMNSVKREAHAVVEKYDSDTEFYLTEFSKEEILQYSQELFNIKFGRYIPTRLENESLGEYLKRYEVMKKEFKLNKNNSRDMQDYFKDKIEWIPILSTCSLLYSMNYSEFVASTFIIKLVECCVHYSLKFTGAFILGLSESFLNIIDKTAPNIELEDYFFDRFEDTLSIVDGFYTTSVKNRINEFDKEYSSMFLNTSESIVKGLLKNDIKSFIEELVDLPSALFKEPGEEEELDDKEQSLKELDIYCISNELHEILG